MNNVYVVKGVYLSETTVGYGSMFRGLCYHCALADWAVDDNQQKETWADLSNDVSQRLLLFSLRVVMSCVAGTSARWDSAADGRVFAHEGEF